MSDHRIDEILKLMWTAEEEKRDVLEWLHQQYGMGNLEEVLAQTQNEQFIDIIQGKPVFLPRGRLRAEEIIRRHRLAERLFSDVFEAPHDEFEQLACSFEHIISSEVADSVCTFLGHPRVCPHNRPIPQGKCCLAYTNEIQPLIQPLSTVSIGQRARIVYMIPSHQKRWGQLHQLGIFPGNVIRLIQRKPSFVVEVGETTLALDDEICNEIFVKRLP